MNNDFTSFELAIKLKEKGFPQHQCDYAYIIEENHEDIEREYVSFIPDYLPTVATPTISQVLKWLRNTYNLHVETYPCGLGMWKFLVTNITTLEERALCDKYTSSEQAEIAGISYVLDNLI